MYYTSFESLLKNFDKGRRLAFQAKSEEEQFDWRRQVRSELARVMGLAQMEKSDLAPRQLETVQMDGYSRQKWLLQTEPDVWMPFYLLVPDGLAPGERRPAVLAFHGHMSGGKYAVCGITDKPGIEKTVADYNYAYGPEFAKRGFIVFCPDARGFGERREKAQHAEDAEHIIRNCCQQLHNMGIPLGRTVAGMMVWDNMRLLDFAAQHTLVDAARIGCVGLSGGGMQSMYLAALDDRIAAAVTSGYFYGFRNALLEGFTHCSCNFIPGLYNLLDIGDIGAAIAPRPFFIETGTTDPCNGSEGLSNVTNQAAITRAAYAALDAEERLVHMIYEGGHKWYGRDSYEFMRNALGLI